MAINDPIGDLVYNGVAADLTRRNEAYGLQGDASWAWMVNLTHVYAADPCLDVGELGVAPHGHGWPITANLLEWRWTCH